MRTCLLLVIALTGTVHAQDEDPQARAKALYEEGSKHYTLHEYDAAITTFKQAYALFPEPTILFDLAQAYRQLHQCDDARSFYKSYLRDKPDAEDREQVQKLIGEMDACVEDQHRRAAETPPPVIVTRVVPPAAQHRGLKIAGLATAGIGVLVAGTGIYFSYDAAQQASRLEQMCMTKCAASDVAAIDRKGKASQTDAIALYAVGGSLVGIGAGMFVWGVLHTDPETVTVTPTPGGATVSARIRF